MNAYNNAQVYSQNREMVAVFKVDRGVMSRKYSTSRTTGRSGLGNSTWNISSPFASYRSQKHKEVVS